MVATLVCLSLIILLTVIQVVHVHAADSDADRYKVNLDFTAINVTNKYALYNFLSTFSGTHYVTPRALTAKITLNF
jgi:hypothetical protein